MKGLSQVRQGEIEDLAEAISVSTFPTSRVEPEALAEQEAITTSFGSYGDAFDGMLEWRRGRFHIYCNLDRVHSPTSARARFTLSHELGHYFLDDHRRGLEAGEVPSHPSWVEFVSDLLVEQEADTFAAALLLPEARTRREFNDAGEGLTTILAVAQSLGASVTATALRYVKLDVSPSAVIKWSAAGDYCWRHTAPSWRQKGVLGAAPQHCSELPVDSPTALVLSDSSPGARLNAGSTLSFWFGSVTSGSARDELIVEHAIRLGRHGSLTFLVSANV